MVELGSGGMFIGQSCVEGMVLASRSCSSLPVIFLALLYCCPLGCSGACMEYDLRVGGVGLMMTEIAVRACFVCGELCGGVVYSEWLLCPRILVTDGGYLWHLEEEM